MKNQDRRKGSPTAAAAGHLIMDMIDPKFMDKIILNQIMLQNEWSINSAINSSDSRNSLKKKNGDRASV